MLRSFHIRPKVSQRSNMIIISDPVMYDISPYVYTVEGISPALRPPRLIRQTAYTLDEQVIPAPPTLLRQNAYTR